MPDPGSQPSGGDDSCVKVCVRVRPLLGAEIEQKCGLALSLAAANQLQLTSNTRSSFHGGTETRSFTYDYVVTQGQTQEQMYERCVRPLVVNYLQGYNATILAYGQTGSGKTYTMGTASSVGLAPPDLGIVHRVLTRIHDEMQANKLETVYTLKVSFMEIHNDTINDLLRERGGAEPGDEDDAPVIREVDGEVKVVNLEERVVSSYEEVLECLEQGTVNRATGSTEMNATSSRSHAIFCVCLEQHKIATPEDVMSSKFQFVDLAGSERLKRTKAEGDRKREGIHINSGLLALGNVISALGDPKRVGSHVPFRDSKITRVLQSSLGGNSKTLMVACVSPADINREETLSTLQYANRARNIKNKAVINRDPNIVKMEQLKARVLQLEAALALSGTVVPAESGSGGGETATATSCAMSIARTVNAEEFKFLKGQQATFEAEIRRQAQELRAKRREIEALSERLIIAEATVEQYVAKCELTEEEQKQCDALAQARRRVEELTAKNKRNQKTMRETQRLLREVFRAGKAEEAAEKIGKGMSDDDDDGDEEEEEEEDDEDEGDDDSSEKDDSISGDAETAAAVREALNTSNASDVSIDEDDEEDVRNLVVLKSLREHQHQRTMKELTRVHANLGTDLGRKEQMLASLAKVRDEALTMQRTYEGRISEIEAQKRTVEAELARVSKENSAKEETAERTKVLQRYKEKLAALQDKLQEAKKKLKENQRMRRKMAKNEAMINKLTDEVKATKKQRVELGRKMKERAKTHREWVKEKESTIKQLAKESRKKAMELRKMKDQLTKQANVHRRVRERNTALMQRLEAQRSRKLAARKQRRAANNLKRGRPVDADSPQSSSSSEGDRKRSRANLNGGGGGGGGADWQPHTSLPTSASHAPGFGGAARRRSVYQSNIDLQMARKQREALQRTLDNVRKDKDAIVGKLNQQLAEAMTQLIEKDELIEKMTVEGGEDVVRRRQVKEAWVVRKAQKAAAAAAAASAEAEAEAQVEAATATPVPMKDDAALETAAAAAAAADPATPQVQTPDAADSGKPPVTPNDGRSSGGDNIVHFAFGAAAAAVAASHGGPSMLSPIVEVDSASGKKRQPPAAGAAPSSRRAFGAVASRTRNRRLSLGSARVTRSMAADTDKTGASGTAGSGRKKLRRRQSFGGQRTRGVSLLAGKDVESSAVHSSATLAPVKKMTRRRRSAVGARRRSLGGRHGNDENAH